MTINACFTDLIRPGRLASILCSCILAGATALSGAAVPEARVVQAPPTEPGNAYYVKNRAPLKPSPFVKLPIGAIKPQGWLRQQLELEAEGMTGHLQEISGWCKFEGNAWASPNGQGHSGWEELPYWLKGYGDLGYVLENATIKKEAQKWIDAVLASQEPDGWFGPRSLKSSLGGKPDLWPHMVMCNVLQSYQEHTGDERVVPFLTRYFKWLNTQPGENFGAGYWPKLRFGDNIETVFWVYNRTGEPWLLDLSRKIHENMAKWHTGIIDWHNVNIAQGFREPTVFWQQGGEQALLEGAERNYHQVTDVYGQFPGGGFAGDENCRRGYVDPRQGFETCGFVEFMHSFEMLTRITGNPVWADRCENIAINSLPATMTPDAKGLHYLTCANQVQLDRSNKSPGIQNGGNMFAYSPFEVFRCCQHNVSHGWPYYAEELWLATPDNGLCASLYAASEVSAKVGDGTPVRITSKTEYPFGETIELNLAMAKAVQFPLYLRVPGWCTKPAVKVNGKTQAVDARPGTFVVINRNWKDGDKVVLQLPMQITVRRWEANNNAASVHYGPVTFSLQIGERWAKYGGRNGWDEWEVFPTTAFNYALDLGTGDPARSLKLVRKASGKQPFTQQTAPLIIQAKARKVPAWKQDAKGLLMTLQKSPVKTTEPETVTLIPMGAARLRISAFPVVGTGAEAQEWAAAKVSPITASHSFEGDSPTAVVDGRLPKSSNDDSIPRFTWWDHRGTTEWIQQTFPAKRKVSGASVYWFDDSGKGSCRVPASWRVLYLAGSEWKPVAASGDYGTRPDMENRVSFAPVETSALRIEVKLQPEYSGGILEWKTLE